MKIWRMVVGIWGVADGLRWLTRPNMFLNGRRPITAIVTGDAKAVENLLGQIEGGVYS